MKYLFDKHYSTDVLKFFFIVSTTNKSIRVQNKSLNQIALVTYNCGWFLKSFFENALLKVARLKYIIEHIF